MSMSQVHSGRREVTAAIERTMGRGRGGFYGNGVKDGRKIAGHGKTELNRTVTA